MLDLAHVSVPYYLCLMHFTTYGGDKLFSNKIHNMEPLSEQLSNIRRKLVRVTTTQTEYDNRLWNLESQDIFSPVTSITVTTTLVSNVLDCWKLNQKH